MLLLSIINHFSGDLTEFVGLSFRYLAKIGSFDGRFPEFRSPSGIVLAVEITPHPITEVSVAAPGDVIAG